jgi:hypothetical protein
MDGLQTEYFLRDPDMAEIQARVAEPRVQSAMKRKPWLPRKPVYMISGVMIARGLNIESSRNAYHQGTAGVEVAAPTPAADAVLGANLSGSHEKENSDEISMAVDVVFAYQLLKIKYKNLSSGLDIDEYQPKDAFQGLPDDGNKAGNEDEDLELSNAVFADVNELESELLTERVSLGDDRELLMISFPERA